MPRRKLTNAITFSMSPQMYEIIKTDSETFGISAADLMRRLIEDYINGTRTYSRPAFGGGKTEETGIKEPGRCLDDCQTIVRDDQVQQSQGSSGGIRNPDEEGIINGRRMSTVKRLPREEKHKMLVDEAYDCPHCRGSHKPSHIEEVMDVGGEDYEFLGYQCLDCGCIFIVLLYGVYSDDDWAEKLDQISVEYRVPLEDAKAK